MNTEATTRFDESLPRLVNIVVEIFGNEIAESAAFVRDAGGRLAVVLANEVADERLQIAAGRVEQELGAYARPDRAVTDIRALGAKRLIEEAQRLPLVRMTPLSVHIIDRRIVGPDWLYSPSPSATRIPRVVFASLKGGVGRSTALCVFAAHLSRRGRRVLTLDFDLEAPGIGTMLLAEDQLPRYGALDYLVENCISGTDPRFMTDMVGDSILGSEGGRVAVIPAIGHKTVEYPQNALAKISRAYLEGTRSDGSSMSLSDQLRGMLDSLEESGAYDVALIDARAGLSETTAPAILGLGAEVLFFGLDHPQTYLGYRLLMAHLSQFSSNPDDDWRERLHFVHAKASDSPLKRTAAAQRFSALYEIIAPQKAGLQALLEEPLGVNDFEIGWKENSEVSSIDEFSPPPVLHILDDARYRDFNPIADSGQLGSASYASTFEDILSFADALLGQSES